MPENIERVKTLSMRRGVSVSLCLESSTGRYVCVKEAGREQKDVWNSICTEFDVLSSVSHVCAPHVIGLDMSDLSIAVIYEYLPGKPLSEIRPLSRAECEHVATCLLSAVGCLHDSGFSHNDLSDQNLIIDLDAKPVGVGVLDFGLAARLGHGRVAGTPGYIADELLAGAANTVQTDLFAVGMLIMQMALGQRPTSGHSIREQGDALRLDFNHVMERMTKHVGSAFTQWAAKFVEKDPSLRWQDAHFASMRMPRRKPSAIGEWMYMAQLGAALSVGAEAPEVDSKSGVKDSSPHDAPADSWELVESSDWVGRGADRIVRDRDLNCSVRKLRRRYPSADLRISSEQGVVRVRHKPGATSATRPVLDEAQVIRNTCEPDCFVSDRSREKKENMMGNEVLTSFSERRTCQKSLSTVLALAKFEEGSASSVGGLAFDARTLMGLSLSEVLLWLNETGRVLRVEGCWALHPGVSTVLDMKECEELLVANILRLSESARARVDLLAVCSVDRVVVEADLLSKLESVFPKESSWRELETFGIRSGRGDWVFKHKHVTECVWKLLGEEKRLALYHTVASATSDATFSDSEIRGFLSVVGVLNDHKLAKESLISWAISGDLSKARRALSESMSLSILESGASAYYRALVVSIAGDLRECELAERQLRTSGFADTDLSLLLETRLSKVDCLYTKEDMSSEARAMSVTVSYDNISLEGEGIQGAISELRRLLGDQSPSQTFGFGQAVSCLLENKDSFSILGRERILWLMGDVGRRLWSLGGNRATDEFYHECQRLARGWGHVNWRQRLLGNRLNLRLATMGTGELNLRIAKLARLREDAGDCHGASRTWGNLGVANFSAGNYPAAIAAWAAQKEIAVLLGSQENTQSIDARLAAAEEMLGQLNVAIELYEGILWKRSTGLDSRLEITVRLNLSRLYLAKGHSERAAAVLGELSKFVGAGSWTSAARELAVECLEEVWLENGSFLSGECAVVWSHCVDDAGCNLDGRNSKKVTRKLSATDLRFREARLAGGTPPSMLKEMAPDLSDTAEGRSVLRVLCSDEGEALSYLHRDVAEVSNDTASVQCCRDTRMLSREVLSRAATGAGLAKPLVSCLKRLAKSLELADCLQRLTLAEAVESARRDSSVESIVYLAEIIGPYRKRLLSVPEHSRSDLCSIDEYVIARNCLEGVSRTVLGPADCEKESDERAFDWWEKAEGLLVRVFSVVCSKRTAVRSDREGRFEEVLKISRSLISEGDLESLLSRVASSLIELCSGEHAFVVLLDSEGRLGVVFSAGEDESSGDRLEGRVSNTIVMDVVSSGKPRLVLNALDDEAIAASPSIISLSLRSAMCAPLVHEGVVVGAVYVDNRTAVGRFGEEDLRLLEIYANSISAAIQNRKLIDSLRESYQSLARAHEMIVRSEKLRVLGEMAGGVAHDFNNLLTAILVRTQMLQGCGLNEDVERELKLIEMAAIDGANAIRRIQDFSRNRQCGDFSEVDVRSAIGDALEFTRNRWDTRSSETQWHVSMHCDDDVVVLGNASELREVFTNLILNSLEAMPAGGQLRITARVEEACVCVRFDDEGLGVPAGLRDRIFDPFFSTKGDKGNGLGLSVVFGIVSRHSGKVWVEDSVLGGACFICEIPLVPTGTPCVYVGDVDQEHRALRVLVVEDEEAVRGSVGAAARRLGHSVWEVDSGEMALEVLGQRSFDVVLSDCDMSGISGVELLQQLGSNGFRGRRILMTGSRWDVSSGSVRDSVADTILRKPFEIVELERVLAEAGRVSGAGGG